MSSTTYSSESTNVVTALGTLVGYIGAEAAKEELFERLFWPQRFWNGLSFRNTAYTALFMPMGGPLHKAALGVLDELWMHNLFTSSEVGHMLGTVFFRDSHLQYGIWAEGAKKREDKAARNCLWVRAVALLPMSVRETAAKSLEAGATRKDKLLRSKTTVNLIRLEDATDAIGIDKVPVVSQDTGPVTFKAYIALLISESTGIIIAILVAVLWRSYFSFLWVLPLALKIISALFAVEREGLLDPSSGNAKNGEKEELYEVIHPGKGFFIIEGKTRIVSQFFRHYGHPIRHRLREVVQFTVIVGLGLIFPVGLVSSAVWMPLSMQYLWLGYQLYTTLAMHAYRYSHSQTWATTEELIARKFLEQRAKGQDEVIAFRDSTRRTVLATLSSTHYDNYSTAREEAMKVLNHAYKTDSITPGA